MDAHITPGSAALAQHEQASAGLLADVDRTLQQFGQTFDTRAQDLVAAVRSAWAEQQTQQNSADQQRLDGWKASLQEMATGLQTQWQSTGSQTLAQVLHRQLLPGLDFISTGTTPPNPAELLMAPTTQQLLQGASQQYDIVIIDTPPVLAVADTAVLAPQAGTVFLVARSEVTALGEVQESLKRLTQAGVAVKGAIFNGLDLSKRRYGQSYGYGYGYKRYGYRYQAYQYQATEPR